MTIEFRCPYCTAAIQVADALAGTSGRCPKCAAKVSIPRPAGLASPPKPKPPAPEAPVPTAVPSSGEIVAFPPAVDLPVQVPEEPFAAAAPVVRRRRRSKPVPVGVLIALVVLVVGGGGGALGWFLYQEWDRKQLKGELTAVESDYVDIEPAVIDRTSIAVAEPQRTELLKDLQTTPMPMVSELMQVQFRGSQAGLVVAIARGAKSMWYRVETKSLPVLANYIEQQTASLQSRRNEEVERTATAFLQQFGAVHAKEAKEDSLLPFRDKLGLTSLVRGFGLEAVAVVGQSMYPCVYEDTGGALYFLLPPRLKQFTLQGRPSGNGPPRFAGRFTVKVTSRKVDEGQPPPDLRSSPTETEPATTTVE